MNKNGTIREKGNFISAGITILVGFIMYFFFLPPINLTSIDFWAFLIIILVIYIILTTVAKIDIRGRFVGNMNSVKYISIFIGASVFVLFGINFVLSPFFNSKAYANRIDITENADFQKDVKQVDFSSLPLLDKASSQKLGDRVMGQMSELVSQFYVSTLYTQINYNDEILRVTPLEYNGFFKYLANHKKGVQGYITVNSVDGTSKLVKLEDGMKYMPSAILLEDLDRHLRFSYPTKIFGKKTFEIDNDGNPFWIVPTIKYMGIGLREDISGVIILDAITGDSKYYNVKDVPTWVDHVYDAELIINQVTDWGLYVNGFFNSLFGQKDVVSSTSGYNYIVMNDDVYLYTGITSVASDQSNLGFILSNLRTKETKLYKVAGAEEYSAMGSAEGQVQQMKYVATFPLIVNLNGKATYLISLKDNAGLVKMYAFVDFADYQKVVVTSASEGIEQAAKNYLGNVNLDVDDDKVLTSTITIKTLSTANINGDTYYFITDNDSNKYYVSVTVNKEILPFAKVGDSLNITYQVKKDLTEIVKIK